MNGLSAPPSPSRRPQRGRGALGQGANGARSSRGRGQRGRSLLSSAKPINQSDLENGAQSPLSNGNVTDMEGESAEESDTAPSRGVAFGNVNPENRFEEV